MKIYSSYLIIKEEIKYNENIPNSKEILHTIQEKIECKFISEIKTDPTIIRMKLYVLNEIIIEVSLFKNNMLILETKTPIVFHNINSFKKYVQILKDVFDIIKKEIC